MPSIREMAQQKKEQENKRIEGNALDSFQPERETVNAFEGQQEQEPPNPDTLGLDITPSDDGSEDEDQDEETEQELEEGIEQEANDEEAALDRAVEQSKLERVPTGLVMCGYCGHIKTMHSSITGTCKQDGCDCKEFIEPVKNDGVTIASSITRYAVDARGESIELEIDPEFSNLLPVLPLKEYEGLEKNIVEKGYDESLGKVQYWTENGHHLVIDGHTRLGICEKHGVKYPVEEKFFVSRAEARTWLIDNQLNRHNITGQERDILLGLRYDDEKKPIGAQAGNENSASRGAERVAKKLENDGITLAPLIPVPETKPKLEAESTAQKMAEKEKVSEKKVKEAKVVKDNFYAVAEKAAQAGKVVKPMELASTAAFSNKDIAAMAKMEPEKVVETLEAVEQETNGKRKPKVARKIVGQKKQEQSAVEAIKKVEEKLGKNPTPITQIILQGDFFEQAMEPDSFDIAIFSPDYNLGVDYGPLVNDDLPYPEYLDFTRRYMDKVFILLKETGRACINVPLDTFKKEHHAVYADVVKIAQDAGFQYRESIVWNEGNISSGTAWGSYSDAQQPDVIAPVEMIPVIYKGSWKKADGGVSDITAEEFKTNSRGVWNFPGEHKTKNGHPAPYPKELVRRLIKTYSYVGDTVLDPFVGGGTTIVVCAETGRKGTGIEINPAFCELARAKVAEAEASAGSLHAQGGS